MKTRLIIFMLAIAMLAFGDEPADSLKQVATPDGELVRIPAAYVFQQLEDAARQSDRPALASFSIDCRVEGAASQRVSFRSFTVN